MKLSFTAALALPALLLGCSSPATAPASPMAPAPALSAGQALDQAGTAGPAAPTDQAGSADQAQLPDGGAVAFDLMGARVQGKAKGKLNPQKLRHLPEPCEAD